MREILQMVWDRVDFDRRVGWLDPGTTKTGDGRGLPLNRDAVLALRAVDGQHERWCFTYQGRRMDAVGRRYTFHLRSNDPDFRHNLDRWLAMSRTRDEPKPDEARLSAISSSKGPEPSD